MAVNKRRPLSLVQQYASYAVLLLTAISISACGEGAQLAPPSTDNSSQGQAGDAAFSDLMCNFAAPSAVSKTCLDNSITSRIGADFDPAIPTQRVTVNDSAVTFNPLWLVPANPSHDYLAYAMYSFDLTGYGGEYALQLSWDEAVPATSNMWLGFSDWSRDTWAWRAPQTPASCSLSVFDMVRYTRDSDGALLVLLLMTGSQSATLKEVFFGAPALSTAFAYAMPNQGWAPLNVSLSAFGSDEAGSVSAFEWDLDGDGVYETDATFANGSTSYTYSPGIHTASLRVTYSQGGTAYARVSISARDPAVSSVDYWSVFNQDGVRRVELSVSKANWDIMWGDPDAEIEVEADAVVFPGTGLEAVLPSIGLRMKGNSSLHNPSQKKPWKIDTNEYVEDQEFANLKMLIFNNGFKDPSLTREVLAYDMMYQAGVPSSNACYVEIWISVGGAPLEFWGVYTMVERVDKKFLENRFGDDSGNLYKASMGSTLEYLGDNINVYPKNEGEPCYSKETNSNENDYSDLLSFLRILNESYDSESEFTAALENEFNVDGFLRYLAVTLAHSNLDNYMYMQQNYYLYNNPASARFEWIPWDLNESWGLFGDTSANESHPLFSLADGIAQGVPRAPLFSKVMAVEQYRRDLAAYYDMVKYTTFTEDKIASHAEELHNLIQNSVYQGDKMYVGPGSAYPLVAFDTNWQSDWGGNPGWPAFGVASFTALRAAYIGTHLGEYLE